MCSKLVCKGVTYRLSTLLERKDYPPALQPTWCHVGYGFSRLALRSCNPSSISTPPFERPTTQFVTTTYFILYHLSFLSLPLPPFAVPGPSPTLLLHYLFASLDLSLLSLHLSSLHPHISSAIVGVQLQPFSFALLVPCMCLVLLCWTCSSLFFHCHFTCCVSESMRASATRSFSLFLWWED